MMNNNSRCDLAHDLVLPTLLFAGLGAMSWAVRGSAGAGGMNAHIAPGLLWGTAWWFLAREPSGARSRRYASGWILLALAAGFAIAGERGWMQWHHFFDGRLSTNYPKGEYVPIHRAYGFLWFFIAGTAWAGLPACMLAWCGSRRPAHAWQWTLRIACGLAGAYLAYLLFTRFPEVFLPLYSSVKEKYLDLQANPSLAKLIRDNGSATRHMGLYLGFLLFEVARRDWKNAVLILTVGVINGLGWAALQNWKWAANLWPDATFNFGRCWEASGGITIGIGYGIAYYLVNRRESSGDESSRDTPSIRTGPGLEWSLAAGLLLLVGWTMFWPVTTDLRLGYVPPAENPHHLWGYLYLAIGAAYGIGAVVRYLLAREASRQDAARQGTVQANLEWLGGLGLISVLGWFIQTQVQGGFGDGPRAEVSGAWFGPAGIYFAIVAAYCVACLLARSMPGPSSSTVHTAARRGLPLNLDWLATYLGCVVILSSCLGLGMTGWLGGAAGESAAATSFGIVAAAFGIVYFLMNHGAPNACSVCPFEDPNLERWGAFVGLLYGLGLSFRKAFKGGMGIYLGNENYWDRVGWNWIGLGMLACMIVIATWVLFRPLPRGFAGNVFPRAAGIVWLVLLAENIVAQVVTGPIAGPRASWNEAAFSILYVFLFALTAVIVYHYQFVKSRRLLPELA
jgi:hypothetical protein